VLAAQPLAALATAALHHPDTPTRAHAAKKAVHAAAVPLLWLERSLDGETPYSRELSGTAVVYRTAGGTIVIPVI
jgi:hypothetical protein